MPPRAAAIVFCVLLLAGTLDAVATQPTYTVELRALPGMRFQPQLLSRRVVLVTVDDQPVPHFPVEDLARAVNGSPGLGGRLAIRGSELVAVGTGACFRCLLRVNQTGRISYGVVAVNRAPYFPLEDLARALGGVLSGDQTTGGFAIAMMSPSCNLCQLRPNR